MDFNIAALGQVSGFVQYSDPPEGGSAAPAVLIPEGNSECSINHH